MKRVITVFTLLLLIISTSVFLYCPCVMAVEDLAQKSFQAAAMPCHGQANQESKPDKQHECCGACETMMSSSKTEDSLIADYHGNQLVPSSSSHAIPQRYVSLQDQHTFAEKTSQKPLLPLPDFLSVVRLNI